MKPQNVLITGGSTGIGFELAKLFAADGHSLIIAALDDAYLKEAAIELEMRYDIEVTTWGMDLSQPNAGKLLYEKAKAAFGQIDILVNNAGFATYGYFESTNQERDLAMIRLNVETFYQLAHLCLQDMLARDEGRILNVASTAGMVPSPMFSTYAATKAFDLSLSKAIIHELRERKSKVKLSVLCPPATRSNFQQKAGMNKVSLFNTPLAMDADDVALAAYKGLQKGQTVIIPGWVSKICMPLLQRFFPDRLSLWIVSKMLS